MSRGLDRATGVHPRQSGSMAGTDEAFVVSCVRGRLLERLSCIVERFLTFT
ncbi:hypothetical protein KPSA3_05905 [Pseudomonas syringae pv. actinidiae]|uniref:Uncharacterized protein n=1 Tax=Pseudomonas syringae pv. actinidiae TaxID=103796 RepID=A0AAN4Q9E4_PSESF|nr:hypothetical protein KPSA3_05905 [Pseudomonas syringae pv. actinidiae]